MADYWTDMTLLTDLLGMRRLLNRRTGEQRLEPITDAPHILKETPKSLKETCAASREECGLQHDALDIAMASFAFVGRGVMFSRTALARMLDWMAGMGESPCPVPRVMKVRVGELVLDFQKATGRHVEEVSIMDLAGWSWARLNAYKTVEIVPKS